MNSMNILLPGPLKSWIDEQVAEGRYSNASEYVRELVRADEKAKARERLETLLLEGLASEESDWVPGDIEAIRSAALAIQRCQSL